MAKREHKSLGVNAALNVIKQCCSVIFPLLTYPYISRVLGTANYGRYSFADSVIQWCIIFANVGVPTYAIREISKIRDDEKLTKQLSSQLLMINICTMLVSYVALLLLMLLVPRINRETAIIAILSINIFANVFGRDWINTVYEDFLYTTIRYIIFQVISFVCIFLFVKSVNSLIIYSVIMMIAYSGGYIVNIFYTKKYIPFSITFHIDWRKHIKPIFLLFCSTLAINIYVNSDIVILAFLRSDSDVGVYTLVSKIYLTIKSVINAVTTVAIPRLSYSFGIGDLKSYNTILKKLRLSLMTIVLPAIIGIIFLSKDIMYVMGGKAYISGSGALSILAIALGCAIFGCFYTQAILIPCGKEKVFTAVTFISAVSNIGLNFFLIPIIGIYGAALTTLIAELVTVIISVIKAKDIHDKFDKVNIPIVIGCFGVILCCSLVKLLSLSEIPEMIISIVLSVTVYFIVMVMGKNTFVLSIVSKVLKRKS